MLVSSITVQWHFQTTHGVFIVTNSPRIVFIHLDHHRHLHPLPPFLSLAALMDEMSDITQLVRSQTRVVSDQDSQSECRTLFQHVYSLLYQTPITHNDAREFEELTHKQFWRCEQYVPTQSLRERYWAALDEHVHAALLDELVSREELQLRRNAISRQVLHTSHWRNEWLDKLAPGCEWRIRWGHMLVHQSLVQSQRYMLVHKSHGEIVTSNTA